MDQTGTETQRQQLHPSQVGQAADKSGYRLFPVADQRQQVSPKTLQKQTLGRAGSISKRRSVSLDDASRRDVLTRTPFARTGNNPVPRIQAVPPNRSKITKAYGNNTSSESVKSPLVFLRLLTADKIALLTFCHTNRGSQTMADMEDHQALQETSFERAQAKGIPTGVHLLQTPLS